MGAIIAILFLIGSFMVCTVIASWFVEGTTAAMVVGVLLLIGIFILAGKEK